jgi:hypothetical protein
LKRFRTSSFLILLILIVVTSACNESSTPKDASPGDTSSQSGDTGKSDPKQPDKQTDQQTDQQTGTSLPKLSYTFMPSGLDGAGFQNVVAIQPGNPNYVLSGADVAGIHLSKDGGATWQLSNKGLEAAGARHIAALVFLDKQTVFAAVGGQNGFDGGLYRSTDAGVTWTVFSALTKFSGGNNKNAELPDAPHPRSTGNLLAFDSHKTALYAGTFKDGVFRCSLDGKTPCVNIGMKGLFIRSLAIDPTDDNLLYAAAYNGKSSDKTGVFKGTGVASGSGEHFAKMTDSPASEALHMEEMKFLTPQQLIIVGSDANGTGKVYRVEEHGAKWTELLSTNTTIYESVNGYMDESGKLVVLVGTSDHPEGNKSVLRSTDGGATWNPVEENPDKLVGGEPWWYTPINKGGLMNGNTYVAADIEISDTPDRTMYIAGRAGVWKSADKGLSWQPSVRHMNVTINHNVEVDPHTDRVFVVDTDWKLLVSDNKLDNVLQNLQGVDQKSVSGLSMAVDAAKNPSTIYLGVGNRDANKNGALYSTTDPVNGAWISENLDLEHGAKGFNGQRIIGLAAKTSGNDRLLLAAVEGKGMYLKKGGQWSLVNSSIAARAENKTVPIVFDSNKPFAYAYDRETGVWRSGDDGQTWTQVYRAATKEINRNETGYIALDAATDTLYISNDKGLFVQSEASRSDFHEPKRIQLPPFSAAGPIAFGGGQLYMAGMATNKGNPSVQPTADLFVYSAKDGLRSAGDAFYQANGGFPNCIAVGPDGVIYVGMGGPGVLVGKPAQQVQRSQTAK